MPTDASARTLEALLDETSRIVVGQRDLLEGLIVALVARGHALVEGVPGLAKTTAIRTLAQGLGLDFGRIQFTPDLLPGDLTGSLVYTPGGAEAGAPGFTLRRGPIFHSVLLADEINRAPAKVQSALLEAMAEEQVTIGDETLPLPPCFFVMATQNPIELEGTYALPEAQLDRFTVKLRVTYPNEADEQQIVERSSAAETRINAVADLQSVLEIQNEADKVHVDESVRNYAVRVVRATREQVAQPGDSPLDAAPTDTSGSTIALGASPRASIALVRIARARALLAGRDFVLPDDIKRSAPDVLRHRLALHYEAEAAGADADGVIRDVLSRVDAP